MELYIIRHTPVDLEKGTCYGQSDVELIKDFIDYSSYYKNELPATFDKIISSPLKRCTQLVTELGFNNYETDKRLMEMNFGDWELKKWDDIPMEESENWMTNFDSVSTPNGESMQQLFDRVNSFYQEIKNSPYQKVLLVTHAGPIRCFWKIILAIDLKNTMKIPVDFGEVLVLDTTFETINRKK
ncbi:MAG: alpha-ribazole phosphatase [Weeksellaceae bacterium]|nr:alpha-ribazole phosphatase [Weeksellaceae bacterium]